MQPTRSLFYHSVRCPYGNVNFDQTQKSKLRFWRGGGGVIQNRNEITILIMVDNLMAPLRSVGCCELVICATLRSNRALRNVEIVISW